jgi:hypothetical protein
MYDSIHSLILNTNNMFASDPPVSIKVQHVVNQTYETNMAAACLKGVATQKQNKRRNTL